MRAITIRNFRKWAILAVGLGLGVLGYHAVGAQPGQSPNFAWLRGAAIGSDPALVCQGLDASVDCNIVPQGGGTLLVNGVAIPGISGGAGVFSSLTVNGLSTFNGLLTARPGASVINDNLGAIVLSNSSTNVTTTLAATEQDLFNFSVPASTLSANNQYVVLSFRDRNAATANTKRLRFYFGATVIGDSTAVASNDTWWNGDCVIWRTGAATQKAICQAVTQGNGVSWATATGAGANISTPAETLSGAVVVRVTGTDAVAAGGSNLEGVNLVWYPAGQ